MKAILFGATGMVGQAALRACLLDPRVEHVLAVVRNGTGVKHPKLAELFHRDFFDFESIAATMTGYDACLYCLGVSAAAMSERAYHRITYDIALAAGQTLAARNPAMTFLYVSGAGTDATEKGRSMWARVKGKTENALMRLPFKAAYMLRPGFIRPMHGVKSKTALYRLFYAVAAPLHPLLNALAPNAMTTSENVGLAMIEIALHGAPKTVLENADINALAAGSLPVEPAP